MGLDQDSDPNTTILDLPAGIYIAFDTLRYRKIRQQETGEIRFITVLTCVSVFTYLCFLFIR